MSPAGPHIRSPAVAGRFYEADPARCGNDARRLCEFNDSDRALPDTLYGGIVPHAGWVCSGRVAGLVFAALKPRTAARTIVLTGSVHTMAIFGPTLDSAAAWSTPLGDIAIDDELRQAMLGLDDFAALDMAHQYEHSLEVQVPLILTAFGADVRIVPCLIPPVERAADWGAALGGLLAAWESPVIMVASSDLTHYGPNYRFTPQGVGEEGIRWAHEVNDRHLLDEIERMNEQAIVPETKQRQNACGGGAISATIAACRAMGATSGYVLDHTNSCRELETLGYREKQNSVGYAGIVFG